VNILRCPFSANSCRITTDYNRFYEADAVVYHMMDPINSTDAKEKRRLNQRFVFALWESPVNTPDISAYRQFFNWTMTYRFDSHIVASYYSENAYIHKSSNYLQLLLRENSTRKLNLKLKTYNHWQTDAVLENKTLGTVAALISNCHATSRRLRLIWKLQRYIDVKLYGRCGLPCPSNRDCREFIAEKYYFILSFENSLCKDYTSKSIELLFRISWLSFQVKNFLLRLSIR